MCVLSFDIAKVRYNMAKYQIILQLFFEKKCNKLIMRGT